MVYELFFVVEGGGLRPRYRGAIVQAVLVGLGLAGGCASVDDLVRVLGVDRAGLQREGLLVFRRMVYNAMKQLSSRGVVVNRGEPRRAVWCLRAARGGGVGG